MKLTKQRYYVWLAVICSATTFLATDLHARRRKKSCRPHRSTAHRVVVTTNRDGNLYHVISKRARELHVKIGFCAELLERSIKLDFNADNLFPMASTCKIPIALAFLKAVDEQRCSLDECIQLKPSDWRPGPFALSKQNKPLKQTIYMRDFLKYMLEYSDNISADIVLKKAGGPLAVTQLCQRYGINGIHVDRTLQDLMADADGMSKAYGQNFRWITRDALYKKREAKIAPAVAQHAHGEFMHDPRDTSSPRAMNELLKKICFQEMLTPCSNQLLLNHMLHCRANSKIPALLPSSIMIYHKTGYLPGITNDVGIIELPNKAGTIVMSIFVKGPLGSTHQGSRLIAQTARLIYNYMMKHLYKTPAV